MKFEIGSDSEMDIESDIDIDIHEHKPKKLRMDSESEADQRNINEVLNDDCLLRIFNYLDVSDRIKAFHCVCRRWETISLKSWDNAKILNQHQCISQSVSHDDLVKIVERCGDSLTTLDLDGFDHIGPSFIIYLTSKKCPNLQILHLGDSLTSCECPVLSDIGGINTDCGICLKKTQVALHNLKSWSVRKQLKKICMPFRISVKQDKQQLHQIRSLLSKLKNLELLELDLDYAGIQKTVFEKIPFDTLKDVSFLNCNFMKKDTTIATTLTCIRQLRKVAFQFFPRCRILEALIPRAETLDTLALDFSETPDPLTHRPILQLVNLRKLYLHNDDILDNTFLAELVKYCEKLTLFSFSVTRMCRPTPVKPIPKNWVCHAHNNPFECDHVPRVTERVTDAGISHLSRLKDLKFLFLHDSQIMTGQFLTDLKNLNVFSCRFVYDIEEEYLSTLVRQSPELRILDVVTTPNQFPKRFLKTVVNVMHARENDIVLEFTDSEKQISKVCDIYELPKLLKIVDRINLPYSFRGGDSFPMLYE